jgi:hypothetical protein
VQQITTLARRPDLEIGTPSRSVSLLHNNKPLQRSHWDIRYLHFLVKPMPRMQLGKNFPSATFEQINSFLRGSVVLLLVISIIWFEVGMWRTYCRLLFKSISSVREQGWKVCFWYFYERARELWMSTWNSCVLLRLPPPRALQCTHMESTQPPLSPWQHLALACYLFCLCVMRVQPRSIQSIS